MKLLSVLAVALLAVAVHADIPTHCLYNQVLGEWDIYEGFDGHNKHINCSEPFVPQSTFRVRLMAPDMADDGVMPGLWTLIYDEGIEITLPGRNRKYFAYLKYTQEGQTVTSHCNVTFPGWAHEIAVKDPQNWSCYVAVQRNNIGADNSVEVVEVAVKPASKSTMYKPETKLVEAINAAGLSWTATEYTEFADKTVEEMTRFRGTTSAPIQPPMESFRKPITTSDPLPASWDWRNVSNVNYVSPVRNQQSCGSCYAFSTCGMMEARTRIATGNLQQPTFSPQAVVSCSEYSQGCEGGFPYLISKYGSDFGMLQEKCYPYTGQDSPCNPVCEQTEENLSWFTNYYYVGGYFGGDNEAAMRAEIFINGPVAISFEVENDFTSYKSGVYAGCTTEHRARFQKLSANPWVATNHAVLMVGWGTTDAGEDYWIVKNSWGPGWGMDGYFLIKRGVDMCGIETMAVATTPVLKL